MSIIKSLNIAQNSMKNKEWDCIYVAVDLHGTCIIPNYSNTTTPKELYPGCIKPLKNFSNDPRVKLIMYTCSHPEQIDEYLDLFKSNGVVFDFVNENPEVTTQGSLEYGNYDQKFYFNLLLDDKAGFDPEIDWTKLMLYQRDNSLIHL